MKKIVSAIVFIFGLLFPVFGAYYEANSDIQTYLDDVTDKFTKISSYIDIGDINIPTEYFASLANDFSVLKSKLPQIPNFVIVYNSCELTSRKLSQKITNSNLNIFISRCFSPWKELTRKIFTKYAVQAKIKAIPKSGNAPLTVTFDGRDSYDPSADTIPSNNYFWYYKDSNGVQHLIGQGPVIKYTFNEPNTYIVHLTVRSVNKQQEGILDGTATTSIQVAPPVGKIVLYINGIRADGKSYVKVSSKEGKLGVTLDASGTTPNGERKIVETSWLVKKRNKIIYSETIPDTPGAIKVKLPENGYYFVTLKIKDNTGKITSKTYKIIVSNPVAIIKVTPESGNTSTKFKIDALASYSVNGKIISYKWTIIGPNGNKLDSFQGKISFTRTFNIPGVYTIKLEVEDVNGEKNIETYKLNVDSTPPVANFIYDKYDNWEKPSTFIFDASLSSDIDIKYGDKLYYNWSISNSKYVKTQYINNGEKLIAQFNKKGIYKVTLSVKDKYGKSSSITKDIKIESTLRPQLEINPNYTILGNPIKVKVKTNKPTAYFEYYFGDGKFLKTQQNFVEHTYNKAGVYNLKVKAFSVDGDENSISANVFIGQRGYPLAIYSVYVDKKQLIPSEYCKIEDSCKNGKGCKFAPAYSVERMQDVLIDASKSVNGQGYSKMLKIYFKDGENDEYINKSKITKRFLEKGCKYLTLYVRDLSTNKVDKKVIYFKVKNAKPILKDIKMYFPQYGGRQSGTFQPRVGTSNVPRDIFTTGFDPLLVRIVAVGARDKDSSILSYYRWYYYKEGDRANPIEVKITPYNIPEAVFSVPRIPGMYIFGVDVCDVDGGCTNSEDYLHLKPIVNISPSNKNPDIPQVNSVRIDYNGIKGVGEVNVGDKVTIVVNASIASNKPDFISSRTIKYDFDNDGKWDLVTKSAKVEHIYTKPGKYKVKVMVIYRGYGGKGYSAPLIVKKGLKPLVDINYTGQDLIFYDMSYGNIEKKKLCFDIKNCKKKRSKYLFTHKDYGHVFYETTGKKLVLLKFEDAYGNVKSIKKTIYITSLSKKGTLLTLPKAEKESDQYKITLAGSYTDSFIVYYRSKNPSNCYIDKNILVDTNQDGDLTNDHDLGCDEVYKLTYQNIPEVVLMIHDGKEKKKIKVILPFELVLSQEYQKIYQDLQAIIYKYSSSDDENIKILVKYLSDLLNNIDDKFSRDAILLEIHNFLQDNPGLLEKNDLNKLENLIKQLSDKEVIAATTTTALEAFENDLEIYLDGISEYDTIKQYIEELKTTTSKDKRKEILSQIYKILGKLNQEGKIDQDYFEDLKTDICAVLKDYQIPSKACGTEIEPQVPIKETGGFSSILKIIGYILLAMIVVFIIIIVIFVIKAKQRREQEEEDNE